MKKTISQVVSERQQGDQAVAIPVRVEQVYGFGITALAQQPYPACIQRVGFCRVDRVFNHILPTQVVTEIHTAKPGIIFAPDIGVLFREAFPDLSLPQIRIFLFCDQFPNRFLIGDAVVFEDHPVKSLPVFGYPPDRNRRVDTVSEAPAQIVPQPVPLAEEQELQIGKQLHILPQQGAVLLQKILHLMQQRGIVITESDPGHGKEILSEQKSLPLNDTTSAPFRHVFFANLQAFYIPGSCTASLFGRVFNGGAAPLCRTSKNRAEACILPAERVQ